MKKIVLSLTLLVLILGFSVLILAESNDSSADNINKSINWTIRCQAVNNRVEGRISQYNSDKDKHFQITTKLVTNLQNIISKAKAKEFDTTTLEADLTALNTKVSQFQTDYALFIQKLTNTRNFTCGHSEGQFQAALNDSKAQLKVVRDDVDGIKQFYQTTIKTDIQSLKSQINETREARRNMMQQRLRDRGARIGNRTMPPRIPGDRNNTERLRLPPNMTRPPYPNMTRPYGNMTRPPYPYPGINRTRTPEDGQPTV